MHKSQLIESLPSAFRNEFAELNDSSDSFCVVIRCNVLDASGAQQWLEEFSALSNTQWIVKNTFPNLRRFRYKKSYTCHRAAKNKTSQCMVPLPMAISPPDPPAPSPSLSSTMTSSKLDVVINSVLSSVLVESDESSEFEESPSPPGPSATPKLDPGDPPAELLPPKAYSYKNTDCEAKLTIKIKHSSKGVFRYDNWAKRGLPCVVTLSGQHNHAIRQGNALSFRTPAAPIRKTYDGYFRLGMTVPVAVNHHRARLDCANLDSDFDTTDAAFNPKNGTVHYWYAQWLEKNGDQVFAGDALWTKLDEQCSALRQQGFTIKMSRNPVGIAILSPIMKRVHGLESSAAVVYVDSTAPVDVKSYSITFMVTPTRLGLVPCGVIITSSDYSESSIRNGFELLKQGLDEINSFGGCSHPCIFVTDDFDPVRNALSSLWPESRHLLCQFRVLQATWRWLCDADNEVEKEDRRELMLVFRTILYSDMETEAETLFEEFRASDLAVKYPDYENYVVEKYWDRRKLWCSAFRDLTILSDNQVDTNEYGDINCRIFKNIILNRQKCYNLLSLLNFIGDVLEDYWTNHLMHFAHPQDSCRQILIDRLRRKSTKIPNSSITKIETNVFNVVAVPINLIHEVDAENGLCSCRDGLLGKFCQHQSAVFAHFAEELIPSANEVSPDDRWLAANLAVGNEDQLNVFLGLNVQEKVIVSLENISEIVITPKLEPATDGCAESGLIEPRLSEMRGSEKLPENFNYSLVDGDNFVHLFSGNSVQYNGLIVKQEVEIPSSPDSCDVKKVKIEPLNDYDDDDSMVMPDSEMPALDFYDLNELNGSHLNELNDGKVNELEEMPSLDFCDQNEVVGRFDEHSEAIAKQLEDMPSLDFYDHCQNQVKVEPLDDYGDSIVKREEDDDDDDDDEMPSLDFYDND